MLFLASNRLVGCKQSDTVSKISTKDESNTQRSDIEYYDDVYFDSDDEKEQDCEGGKKYVFK